MYSRAHHTLRAMHDRRAFRITVLAREMGVHPNTLRYVLTGAMPKVSLAFLLQDHLAIPILDWTVPAEQGDFPRDAAVGQ